MTATLTDSRPAGWLNHPDLLRERLIAWRDRGPIALDTEFVRERTYWPKLALVQLAVPGEIVLVDMLTPDMPEALAPLLEASDTVKIMHAAGEDLVTLGQTCNTLPTPLFDTQIAAGLAGLGASLGYQALVAALTGATIDKGETRSDWLQRPLTDAQLRYAAEDVRHLHALRDELHRRLDRLGRLDWLAQDCRRLLAAATAPEDPWPHLALRSSQGLDLDSQRRLCALLRWRERQAIQADKPKTWILANDLAVLLARRPPANLAELDRLLGQHARAPRKLREDLWSTLNECLPDADGFPLAEAPGETSRRRLRRLQNAVAVIAAELDLPEPLLASRRHLEALSPDGDWPEALQGWRRALLEPALRPLLDESAKNPVKD